MTKNDFQSTEKLEKEIVNRKKTCDNEKINWLKMKEIKLLKEKKYSIFIKTDYNGNNDYKEIIINKKKGRRDQSNFSYFLKPLWPNGKPVAEAKINDIKSYLHLIPASDYHFYTNITGNPSIEEDIDGFNGELDFELDA